MTVPSITKRSLAGLAATIWIALAVHAIADASSSTAGEPHFSYALDSCSYGGTSVADLDGDGDLEAVFGTYYSDERVVALHHDGTKLWSVSSEGGPIDNSVTVADLNGDGVNEVMWGDSGYTTFHVADASGKDIWSRRIGEVLDAPEAIGDLDGDGDLDIALASCGGEGEPGGLRAFDGASGDLLWTAAVGGCYQSAPLLFDQDGDGVLDIVVSTWFDNKVRGFSGINGVLRWEAEIGEQTYHAGSFADLNGDGVMDVALGDYSAQLWAIDGSNGDVLWSHVLPGERYVFGPTAMADVDGDGTVEIIVAAARLHVYGRDGTHVQSTDLPGYCTRGPVLADVDEDGLADIVLALNGPSVQVRKGTDLSMLFTQSFGVIASHNHHPAVADIDGDGANDLVTVFGRGSSEDPEDNWGEAVALTLGGSGPTWPTYSHDHHHSGNYHMPPGDGVNRPSVPTPGPSPEPSPTRASPTVPPTSSPTLQPTTSPSPSPSPQHMWYPLYMPRAVR